MSGENKVQFVDAQNLKVDPEIPETVGQKYVSLAFVCPKDMVKKKMIFTMRKFLVSDVNSEIANVGVQLSKYVTSTLRNKIDTELKMIENIVDPTIAKQMEEILTKVKSRLVDDLSEEQLQRKCLREYTEDDDELLTKYDIYRVENHARLDNEFNDLYDKRTSTHGFKIHGVFDSNSTAEKVTKYFAKYEPYVHHTIGTCRVWMPWNPDADEIQQNKFQIKELDDLINAQKLEHDYRKKMENDTSLTRNTDGDIDYSTSTGAKLHKKIKHLENKKKRETYVGERPDDIADGVDEKKEKKRHRRHKKK